MFTRTLYRFGSNPTTITMRLINNGNIGMMHQCRLATTNRGGRRRRKSSAGDYNDLDAIKTLMTTMDKDIKQTNDVLKANLKSIKSNVRKLERDNKRLNRENIRLQERLIKAQSTKANKPKKSRKSKKSKD